MIVAYTMMQNYYSYIWFITIVSTQINDKARVIWMYFHTPFQQLDNNSLAGFSILINTKINFLTLNVRDRINSVQHIQYHGCWCPDSWRRQDISTHVINYVE